MSELKSTLKANSTQAARPGDTLPQSQIDTPVNLVLIDDDEVERMFVNRCFRKRGLANPIYTATNGYEGLAVLKQTTQAGKSLHQSPCLVVLDLNMPRMDGFKFLSRLRSEPQLAALPVVVITTSDAPEDYAKAKQFDVKDYLLKQCLSKDCSEIIDILQSLERQLEASSAPE